MNYENLKAYEPYKLDKIGNSPEQVHVFDDQSIWAIKAAIAAKRPLLVRGEAGTGKTQLARAAAKALKYAFISTTIDSRCESTELQYTIDAVRRLAEAQIISALDIKDKDEQRVREQLAEDRFVVPGPIWWAFNWDTAQDQAKKVNVKPPAQPDGGSWKNGTVLLIDEIDKADIDLPNGLLEAFGSGQFHPRGMSEPVTRSDNPLLVIITTNEERALPDAFLRRCLVLHLSFSKGEDFVKELLYLGRQHFPKISDDVARKAAEQIRSDRETLQKHNLAAPGLAEYLDLLRAVTELEDNTFRQNKLLDDLKDFVVKKHPEDIE